MKEKREKLCLHCNEPLEHDEIGGIYKFTPQLHFECRAGERSKARAAYKHFYFRAYKRKGSYYLVSAFADAFPLWFLTELFS